MLTDGIAAAVDFGDVLHERMGKQFGSANCPARPQVFETASKLLDDFGRSPPKQIGKESRWRGAGLLQSKVLASQHEQQQGLLPGMISGIENCQGFRKSGGTLTGQGSANAIALQARPARNLRMRLATGFDRALQQAGDAGGKIGRILVHDLDSNS